MYSVFLSSYTNTRESLGELEKAVETLACGSCSHSISRSPKLPLVNYYIFYHFYMGLPPHVHALRYKSLTYNQSPSRLMKLL